MTEIVARRKGGLFALYGSCCLIGVFCLAMAIATGADPTGNYGKAGIIVIGLVLFIVSLIICILYLRTPCVLITYDGSKLSVAGKEYSPSEIGNVTYKRAHARHMHYFWGKLTLVIGGESYSYSFVADVEEVHNRLIALMKEAVRGEKI